MMARARSSAWQQPALVVGLLWCVGGCAGIPVDTWMEPGIELSEFDTFHIVPPPEGIPRVRDRIAIEIAEELEARGYRPAPIDTADMLVVFRGSAERRTRTRSRGDPDAWHARVTERYVAGTLVVDIFDKRGDNRNRVWHGVAEVELASSDELEQDAERAVRAILAELPPVPEKA